MAEKPQGKIASVEFDGLSAPVVRAPVPDLYFQIDPPDATPTIHASLDATNEQIIALVDQNLSLVRELREDMLKRYRHTSSTACRYRTGDIAYVLGRPFFLRVYGAAQRGQMRHAARGRASASTRFYPAVSMVELYVMQPGNYDQGRQAFLSWARPILINNVPVLAKHALEDAGLDPALPRRVMMRPGMGEMIRIDPAAQTLWVSDELVGFPPGCIVYAFMRAATAGLDEPTRQELLEKACPDWRESGTLLRDKGCIYRRQ